MVAVKFWWNRKAPSIVTLGLGWLRREKCSYLQIRVEEFRIVFIFFSFFSGIAVHPMDMVEDEEDSEVKFVKKWVANSQMF